MLLFANIVFLLNIHNLDVKVKHYDIFEFRTSSVFSYGFVREFLYTEYKNSNRNNFFYESEDLSELFFYQTALENDKLLEKRIHMVEVGKNITLNEFAIYLNGFCEIVDINPKFTLGRMDDNLQKINSENIENYSKFIWDKDLKDLINVDKNDLTIKIKKIMEKSVASLDLSFQDYPLLYFYNKIDRIHDVFTILLNLIKSNLQIEFGIIYNSLKDFCENDDENVIMQRYHQINGREITYKSKNFFFSCLLTDIKNILKFLDDENQYVFEMYNFIECRNLTYSEMYVVCIIDLDLKKIKKDDKNRTPIYLFDTENNEINKFVITDCGKKFIILLNKIWCLNNNINLIKIIIHTEKYIYESRYLDISSNFGLE